VDALIFLGGMLCGGTVAVFLLASVRLAARTDQTEGETSTAQHDWRGIGFIVLIVGFLALATVVNIGDIVHMLLTGGVTQ
jgi:ABC-type multidrug transport system permease subunit